MDEKSTILLNDLLGILSEMTERVTQYMHTTIDAKLSEYASKGVGVKVYDDLLVTPEYRRQLIERTDHLYREWLYDKISAMEKDPSYDWNEILSSVHENVNTNHTDEDEEMFHVLHYLAIMTTAPWDKTHAVRRYFTFRRRDPEIERWANTKIQQLLTGAPAEGG